MTYTCEISSFCIGATKVLGHSLEQLNPLGQYIRQPLEGAVTRSQSQVRKQPVWKLVERKHLIKYCCHLTISTRGYVSHSKNSRIYVSNFFSWVNVSYWCKYCWAVKRLRKHHSPVQNLFFFSFSALMTYNRTRKQKQSHFIQARMQFKNR